MMQKEMEKEGEMVLTFALSTYFIATILLQIKSGTITSCANFWDPFFGTFFLASQFSGMNVFFKKSFFIPAQAHKTRVIRI